MIRGQRSDKTFFSFVAFFQREISLSDLKTHLLPTLPSHSTHPPTHLTPVNRGPLRHSLLIPWHWTWILGPRWLQSKGHCLSKTDCTPNNTCSLSLFSPFIEWTTYPQLSGPFSSCGMNAFPVYRRCPIYSDWSPDDNNLHTPLGVIWPAGSQRSPPPTFNIYIRV